MDFSLKTERLLLREIKEEDIHFLLRLETRQENSRYEPEGIPDADTVVEGCRRFMEKAKLLPDCGAVKFVVCKNEGEKLGTVTLRCNWEITKEWEIGYHFLREYWGAGYALESVRSVIEFAFEKISIHKLMAFINLENIRSVALAKRIGMVQEGHMREARLVGGKWNDELVFSLLKSDL